MREWAWNVPMRWGELCNGERSYQAALTLTAKKFDLKYWLTWCCCCCCCSLSLSFISCRIFFGSHSSWKLQMSWSKKIKICLKVAKGWTKSKIKVTQNDFVNLIWVTKEAKVNKMQLKVSRYFLFNYFHVRLLDYSILLKARHNELIHEFIILHNHELIPRYYKAIMRFQLNNNRWKIYFWNIS